MDFFLASTASFSFFSLSLSSSRLFFSFSLIALSYSLSSSVLLGALTPNAPAINLPATAVVFSGLFVGGAMLAPVLLSILPYENSYGVGEAGVGGGGSGDSYEAIGFIGEGIEEVESEVVDRDRPEAGASVSVSEPEDTSSSHESATGAALVLDFGLGATFVESLRSERVRAISEFLGQRFEWPRGVQIREYGYLLPRGLCETWCSVSFCSWMLCTSSV